MNYIQTSKTYRSQAFVERIESSLANISSHPDDEFKLVSAYYEAAEFNCELCGHKHCVYAYEVENLKTGKTLKVGSECVDHFKDKGVDIDLAEAMMKRVYKSTAKARKQIKDDMAQEAWEKLSEEEQKAIPFYRRTEFKDELGKAEMKKLSKEAKRELLIEAYMVVQAKELLMSVAHNKHILSEEEIKNVLDLGLEEQLEKSKKRAEANARYNQYRKLNDEVYSALQKAADDGYVDLDPIWVDNKIKECENCRPEGYSHNSVESLINDYEKQKNNMGSREPIYTYKGNNQVVLNIKSKLKQYGTISMAQERYVLSLIAQENGDTPEHDEELDAALASLLLDNPTDFVKSVSAFYNKTGYATEKQKAAILKIYKKNKK